ncbi:GH21995 [Drosophila grimshawi]|uniref:GH21995 n=1 Tax=Drosophila grimshawi TaxID=7222 RepID=B4J969_DROGR|nr:GH21995 [Drosophila grimshawi]
MKSKSALWALALITLSTLLSSVTAGRLALRPLTPRELGRALVEAGVNKDEEFKPMGRVTPAAYAGLGGYTLGLANGVGSAVLFDMLVSNETANYINNMIANMNATTIDGVNGGTTQEICFGGGDLSGNLVKARNDINYDNDIGDDDDDAADFAYDDDLADGDEEGRQYDDYYYDDPDTVTGGGGGGGNGVTCIVVNRGRALVRRKRSPVKEISPPGETQSDSKKN